MWMCGTIKFTKTFKCLLTVHGVSHAALATRTNIRTGGERAGKVAVFTCAETRFTWATHGSAPKVIDRKIELKVLAWTRLALTSRNNQDTLKLQGNLIRGQKVLRIDWKDLEKVFAIKIKHFYSRESLNTFCLFSKQDFRGSLASTRVASEHLSRDATLRFQSREKL